MVTIFSIVVFKLQVMQFKVIEFKKMIIVDTLTKFIVCIVDTMAELDGFKVEVS